MFTDQNYGLGRETTTHNPKKTASGLVLNRETVANQVDFERIAQLVHRGYYSYEQTEFRALYQKINIYCKVHGPFQQLAIHHLQGYGCKRCTKKGWNIYNAFVESGNVTLYLIKLTGPGEAFYKIGLTAVGVEKRIIAIPYDSSILLECKFFDLRLARKIERSVHDHYKHLLYIPQQMFCGSTRECFSLASADRIINHVRLVALTHNFIAITRSCYSWPRPPYMFSLGKEVRYA